jgi:hypothetical protein
MRWKLLSALPVLVSRLLVPHGCLPNRRLALPPLALPPREAAAFPPRFPRTAATQYSSRA